MTLTRFCRTLAPVALFTLACSDPGDPGSGSKIDHLPRDLSVAEQKLIEGSNAFAFDLLKQINSADRSKNVFISPLSASMALGMTLNGASGETFNAMRSTLKLGSASSDEINAGYKSLITLLRGLDKSTEFQIANSVWYQESFPFSPSFIGDSKTFFNAEVAGLDLSKQSSVDRINEWVNTATNKKIPTIIDSFNGDEVMYLVNAIYFKGTWVNQFDKSKTANAPFTAYDGTTSSVPLMMQDARLRMAFGADYTAIDLPYGNSAFTMTVVLPKQGANINAFVESLTQEKWAQINSSFYEGEGMLYLPKFKLTWKKSIADDLSKLGMGIAFSDAADFGRMSPQGADLLLSDVLQKTFVDVNEEGTEAAAATSVGVIPTSASPTIRVDRPFVFAIRERFSGTILFVGKIQKFPLQ